MSHVYVESTEHKNVRFKVVKFDKETKQGTLMGEYGGTFNTLLTPEALAKHKYEIVQSEEELPLLSAPAKKNPAKKQAVATVDEDE